MGNSLNIINKLLDDLVTNPSGMNFDEFVKSIAENAKNVINGIRNSSIEEMDELYKVIYKFMEIEYALYGRSYVEEELYKSNVDLNKFINYIVKHGNESFDEFDRKLNGFKEYIDESRFTYDEEKRSIARENSRINMYSESIDYFSTLKRKRTWQTIAKTLATFALIAIGSISVKDVFSDDSFKVTEKRANTISSTIETTWHQETIPHIFTRKIQDTATLLEVDGDYNNEPQRNANQTKCVYHGEAPSYFLSLYYFGNNGEPTPIVLDVNNGDVINTYSDAYREVKIVTYEYLGTKTYPLLSAMFMLMTTLMIILLCQIKLDPRYAYSLRGCLKKIKEGEDNLEESINDLDNHIKNLYNELGDFTLLKSNIREIVKDNLHLLNNPELLEQKVDDLIDRNAINKGQAKIKKQRLKTQK